MIVRPLLSVVAIAVVVVVVAVVVAAAGILWPLSVGYSVLSARTRLDCVELCADQASASSALCQQEPVLSLCYVMFAMESL